MATPALSVAGQFVGGALGGPIGATIGRALGALAGSVIDQQLFAEKPPERAAGGGYPDFRLVRGRGGAAALWLEPAGRQYHLGHRARGDYPGEFWREGHAGSAEEREIVASFAVGLCEGEVLAAGTRVGRWAGCSRPSG